MVITVYAGAQKVDEKYLNAAHELGAKIAAAGDVLMYGGGGTGCMGALAQGALENGGKVVGVVPRDMRGLNPLVKEQPNVNFIWTMNMADRKGVMENNSDAIIVLPGGVGSMDEYFEALTLKGLHGSKKPIILLNLDGFYEPVLSTLRSFEEKGFLRQSVAELTAAAKDVAEAMQIINEHFGRK